MKVSDLQKLLSTIDRDARVVLATTNGIAEIGGDIVHVVVTAIDGKDQVVGLSNCVADADGKLIFDAPPQFIRTNADSGSVAAMKQQLMDGLQKPTASIENLGHAENNSMENSLKELLDLLCKDKLG